MYDNFCYIKLFCENCYVIKACYSNSMEYLFMSVNVIGFFKLLLSFYNPTVHACAYKLSNYRPNVLVKVTN